MAIESVRAMLRIGTADPYTSQSIWSLFSGPAGGSLQENGKTPEKISDEAIWEFLQETAERAPHAVGTARMGRDWNDKDAVVDTKYRVKGTQGLRIAGTFEFMKSC